MGGASRRDRADGCSSLLLWLVDAGLAACIFVVPWLMGGRHALGQLVLVALAMLTAAAWMLWQCLDRQARWRPSAVEWILLAAAILLGVQLMPLPGAFLAAVSPQLGQILPLWTSQAQPSGAMGSWSTVSLTPGATLAGLPLLLAYGMLALITVQRVERLADVQRVLRWIALSAVAVAIFGLCQWVMGSEKFFGFYQHPFSAACGLVKGSFTNRNHFANYLALGLAPLLAWWQARSAVADRAGGGSRGWPARGDRDASLLLLVGLGIVVFAGLLSLSRGGAVAGFTATAVLFAILVRQRRVTMATAIGFASVVLLTVAALTIHGFDQVQDRLSQIAPWSTQKEEDLGGRLPIWKADLTASRDFPLLGTGVGSHAEVYPIYMDRPCDYEYTHAENGPIQILLETGIAGFVLLLTGVGLCGRWCVAALRAATAAWRKSEGDRHARSQAAQLLLAAGAVSASLAASLVHSMADFVWYVPACMTVVVVLCGCAVRLKEMAVDPQGRQSSCVALPRPLVLALTVVVMLVGAWSIARCVGPGVAQVHWEQYLLASLAETGSSVSAAMGPEADRQREKELAGVSGMIDSLEQVVRWDPDHGRAYARLAELRLRRFDLQQLSSASGMPLSQLADAAGASGFTSAAAMREWLSRVIGPRLAELDRARQDARRAIELCPLQGQAYIALARLSSLEGPEGPASRQACLAQALIVRPQDGGVLFEAGQQAMMVSGLSGAMELWRKAFRNSPGHRQPLIGLLAGRVAAADFLENFDPDLQSLRSLCQFYVRLTLPEQQAQRCLFYRNHAPSEPESPEQEIAAATAWVDAELVHIRRRYRTAAEEFAQKTLGREGALAWLEVATLCSSLSDRDGEVRAVECAAATDPAGYPIRFEAARRLLAIGQPAAAKRHLTWCYQSNPSDLKLQNLARELVRQSSQTKEPVLGMGSASEKLR